MIATVMFGVIFFRLWYLQSSGEQYFSGSHATACATWPSAGRAGRSSIAKVTYRRQPHDQSPFRSSPALPLGYRPGSLSNRSSWGPCWN